MTTARVTDTEFAERHPVVIMHCDAPGCLRQVRRAPRIIVPSRTPLEPGHRPVRIMTTLHYCDAHAHVFDQREYLTDRRKSEIENFARHRRPLRWKPDFDAARIEAVLVTTPEYRRFLSYILGGAHVVA